MLKHLKTAITTIIILIFTDLITLQAQQYQISFGEEYISTKINTDSALILLAQHHKKAVSQNDTATAIKCLILTSGYNRTNMDFSSAFEHSGEALLLSEEYGDTLLLAKAHEEFGIQNFIFRQNNTAYTHFAVSLSLYKEAYHQKRIKSSELFHPYYYMLLNSQRYKNTKESLAYLDTCYSIIDTTDINPINVVYLNQEKASILEKENKINESEKLLVESITMLENIKDTSRLSMLHKRFLAILYNSMANMKRTTGNTVEAKDYFAKAIAPKYQIGEQIIYMIYVYDKYASLLYKLGNYKEAFEMQAKARKINDVYLNPRRPINQGYISVRNSYQEELIAKDLKFNQQNLELAQNRQKLLIFQIVFVVIIFIFVLIGLMIRNRMQFLKHEKEREINRKKQEQTKELMDFKNKELTASMLQLIEKDEIINTVWDHLNSTSNIQSTLSLLTAARKQSVSLWDAFNSRFTEQNEDFYTRLKEKIPNLSAAELKICALIKLNFSGQEMANLLGISIGSIHVARHRLRKKLDLERDTNLTCFINSI